MQVAGVAAKELSAYHVAFQIAPRLNAAGRLGDASAAVEMLLTDDPRHAADLAAHHEKQNRLRQALQRTIVEEAKERVLSSMDLDRRPCIVLSNPDWHPGVAGLVASKLADTFWRPTFIFCEENGTARGSARSVPGFPLLEAVRRCEDLLERYGGHAGAAGLTLRVENLEPFTERINAVAREMIGAEQPQPLLELEGELRLEELSPAVVDEMRHLAPFGTGNPEPLFMARELRLAGNPQIVGSGQDHLCFLARQGDVALRAIAFGRAGWLKELAARRGDAFSLAFKPSLNTYNGHTAVELRAEDLKWTSAELVERRPAG
jgi:single-stranded-DNA-specific exonuclease